MTKDRALTALLLIAVLLLSIANCRPRPRVITPHAKPHTTSGLAECPHNWSDKTRIISTFAAMSSQVPELNDCQRLVVGNDSAGFHYDSIAGIFVSDAGATYSSAHLATPRALALVYFPYGGTYAPLHLNARFNCVWVQRVGADYRAWVQAATGTADCQDSVAALADQSLSLSVRAQKPDLPGRVPPSAPYNVVRWDWDASTNTQFISVRCGEMWCEIGQPGFGGSEAHVSASSGASTTFDGLRVKGYYDEQYLAEWRDDRLVVGRNVGTIFATPRLATLATGMPAKGEWIPVAEINMSKAAGPYEDMLNLVGNDGPLTAGTRATLSLCLGDGQSCAPVKGEVILNEQSCDLTPDGRWYARIERPGGARYFCVKHRPFPTGFSIPPVVRWRWREDDETIWIRCPDGCCEIDVDET